MPYGIVWSAWELRQRGGVAVGRTVLTTEPPLALETLQLEPHRSSDLALI